MNPIRRLLSGVRTRPWGETMPHQRSWCAAGSSSAAFVTTVNFAVIVGGGGDSGGTSIDGITGLSKLRGARTLFFSLRESCSRALAPSSSSTSSSSTPPPPPGLFLEKPKAFFASSMLLYSLRAFLSSSVQSRTDDWLPSSAYLSRICLFVSKYFHLCASPPARRGHHGFFLPSSRASPKSDNVFRPFSLRRSVPPEARTLLVLPTKPEPVLSFGSPVSTAALPA
mmetsp:Transcript_726/g.1513  ORF Transcript_726/g.1513 Transcript_726/m.1513 type:complete len:225 (-) Transcript_726:24-698(-)